MQQLVSVVPSHNSRMQSHDSHRPSHCGTHPCNQFIAWRPTKGIAYVTTTHAMVKMHLQTGCDFFGHMYIVYYCCLAHILPLLCASSYGHNPIAAACNTCNPSQIPPQFLIFSLQTCCTAVGTWVVTLALSHGLWGPESSRAFKRG